MNSNVDIVKPNTNRVQLLAFVTAILLTISSIILASIYFFDFNILDSPPKPTKFGTSEILEILPGQRPVLDLGLVEVGEKQRFSVILKNPYSVSVKVTDSSVTCGCLKVNEIENSEIDAGQGGKAIFEINPAKPGHRIQYATITFEPIGHPESSNNKKLHRLYQFGVRLYAVGQWIEQSSIDLGRINCGTSSVRSLELHSVGQLLKIGEQPNFSLKVPKWCELVGKETIIEQSEHEMIARIRLRGRQVERSETPLGRVEGVVEVSFNSPNVDKLTVPIFGRLDGNLICEPSTLVFGANPESKSRVLVIRKCDGSDIESVTAKFESISAIVKSTEINQDEVRLTVDHRQNLPKQTLIGRLQVEVDGEEKIFVRSIAVGADDSK